MDRLTLTLSRNNNFQVNVTACVTLLYVLRARYNVRLTPLLELRVVFVSARNLSSWNT
jgi:hypothetical protein